jgi:exopolyphosphatase / guanosine-5'-triphosphate,3'-diphosphate pyrophosphatase
VRAAAIGIGSNSLRLLVADLHNRQIIAVLRAREGLRVFASLDPQLHIAPEMIRQACESVRRLKAKALALGARNILLFATSAVRDAKNQRELSDALYRETGLKLDICTGELEAKLSYIGAAEMPCSGMIDIGGGSTEIVIGDGETIVFSISLQAGAVRLFREMPIHCAEDAVRVQNAVQDLLRPYLEQIHQIKTPTAWVGVGGTMTAAATCIQRINWDSGHGVHGFIVKRSGVREAMETLSDMPPERRRTLSYIPPDRADIIVHGFAILSGCMETLAIESITISERTNLDGYLKLFTADE